MFNSNLPWKELRGNSTRLSDNEFDWAGASDSDIRYRLSRDANGIINYRHYGPKEIADARRRGQPNSPQGNNPSWIQGLNKLNLAQQLGGYPQQTQPAVMPQGGGWDDFVPTQPWNWANNDGLSSGMPGQYQGGNMPNSPTFNYGNPGMFQGFQQPGMYPPQQMQQPVMPQGPTVRADIQEAADRWASGQATAAELQHYGNAPKTQQGFIDRWTDMAGRGKFPGETATSAYVNGSGQQVNAPWMPQRDTAGVSNAPPTRYPQFTGFDGMFSDARDSFGNFVDSFSDDMGYGGYGEDMPDGDGGAGWGNDPDNPDDDGFGGW